MGRCCNKFQREEGLWDWEWVEVKRVWRHLLEKSSRAMKGLWVEHGIEGDSSDDSKKKKKRELQSRFPSF